MAAILSMPIEVRAGDGVHGRLALAGATRSGTAGVGTPARDRWIRLSRVRRGTLIYRDRDPIVDRGQNCWLVSWS